MALKHYIIGLLAILGLSNAINSNGAVRETLVTHDIRRADGSMSPVGFCYGDAGTHGFTCRLGVRGDWLDLTDKVSVVSGPTATVEIVSKGTDNALSSPNQARPSVPKTTRAAEGYLLLKLSSIRGSGNMRLKLERPAVTGRDADFVQVIVKDGARFLASDVKAVHARPNVSGKVGQPFELQFLGQGLTGIRVKTNFSSLPASSAGANTNLTASTSINRSATSVAGLQAIAPEVTIVSGNNLGFTARFNLKNQSAPYTLDTRDIFEFPGAVQPAINSDLDWPLIDVRRAATSAGANTGGAATNTSSVVVQPSTGLSTSTPSNLLPTLSTPATFVRQVNPGVQPVQVPPFFCAAFIPKQEGMVNLPDITYGVSNTGEAVTTAFTVSLVNADTNQVVHSITQQGIAARSLVNYKNWPGRVTQIQVKRVANPASPDNRDVDLCVLTDPRPVNTLLDPKPLVLRVDTGNTVNEGRFENDNDLTINP